MVRAMVITFAAIRAAVDMLEAIVKEWETGPYEFTAVTWRGTPRRAVSAEIDQAAKELFELVAGADIEESHACHVLVLAIDEFRDAYDAWEDACKLRPDNTDPGGGTDLWAPYNRMLAARTKRAYPKPEPIGSLLAQKVPHQQIAKIYGWRDECGTPDLTKVQAEITTPGSQFDSSKWIHPAERRAMAEVALQWSQRAVQARPDRRPSQNEPKVKREAPESLDELIISGINIAQIVKMKHVSEDEVRERAVELQVPLDGSVLATAAAMARRPSPTDDEEDIARKAEDLRLAGVRDYAELGDDRDARILALHGDNRAPRDIVKILANAFPGLQYQKVTRIIEESKLAAAK